MYVLVHSSSSLIYNTTGIDSLEYNLPPQTTITFGRDIYKNIIVGRGKNIASEHASIQLLGNSRNVRIGHIVQGLETSIFLANGRRDGRPDYVMNSLNPTLVSVNDEVQFGDSTNNRFRIVENEGDSPQPPPPTPTPPPPQTRQDQQSRQDIPRIGDLVFRRIRPNGKCLLFIDIPSNQLKNEKNSFHICHVSLSLSFHATANDPPVDYNLLPNATLTFGSGRTNDIKSTAPDIINVHARINRIGNTNNVSILPMENGLFIHIYSRNQRPRTIFNNTPFQLSIGSEVQFGHSTSNKFRIERIDASNIGGEGEDDNEDDNEDDDDGDDDGAGRDPPPPSSQSHRSRRQQHEDNPRICDLVFRRIEENGE